MKEYEVLYTHQKNKKFKTWQDGILKINGPNGSLYDDSKNFIDSLRCKNVVCGDKLESCKFLIEVFSDPMKPKVIGESINKNKNIKKTCHMVSKNVKQCHNVPNNNFSNPRKIHKSKEDIISDPLYNVTDQNIDYNSIHIDASDSNDKIAYQFAVLLKKQDKDLNKFAPLSPPKKKSKAFQTPKFVERNVETSCPPRLVDRITPSPTSAWAEIVSDYGEPGDCEDDLNARAISCTQSTDEHINEILARSRPEEDTCSFNDDITSNRRVDYGVLKSKDQLNTSTSHNESVLRSSVFEIQRINQDKIIANDSIKKNQSESTSGDSDSELNNYLSRGTHENVFVMDNNMKIAKNTNVGFSNNDDCSNSSDMELDSYLSKNMQNGHAENTLLANEIHQTNQETSDGVNDTKDISSELCSLNYKSNSEDDSEIDAHLNILTPTVQVFGVISSSNDDKTNPPKTPFSLDIGTVFKKPVFSISADVDEDFNCDF